MGPEETITNRPSGLLACVKGDVGLRVVREQDSTQWFCGHGRSDPLARLSFPIWDLSSRFSSNEV